MVLPDHEASLTRRGVLVVVIKFRTLAGTPTWSATGTQGVQSIIADAVRQIESYWQERHPDRERPYAQWVLALSDGVYHFTTGIFHPPWSRDESERVMEILLETLVRIDQLWLRLNPETPRLYGAGIRYIPESDGSEEWNAIPEVIREGGADCDDLSGWLSAERRERDGDPEARPTYYWHKMPPSPLYPDGLTMYHIRCRHGDGTIEDPSLKLGMHVAEVDGFKPLPGVPYEVAHGMANLLGSAMLGDQYSEGMVHRLHEHAATGNRRAIFLCRVIDGLVTAGYSPSQTEWYRDADGAWRWHEPRRAT